MKYFLCILIVISIIFSGCSSEKVYVKKYKENIENSIYFYEIRFVLNDGSFWKYYSILKPTYFYNIDEKDSLNISYVLYFQDVRGTEVYLPREVVMSVNIKSYSILDTDLQEYKEVKQEVKDYYLNSNK